MEPNYFLGLLIALPLFLYLIFRKKKIQVKNVPITFRTALNDALSKSKYSGYVDYWLAVSKMETGGFTSQLYQTYNNPWGMKFPTIRPTSASGDVYLQGSNWAKYRNLYDASVDILKWMNNINFPEHITSLETFIGAMKSKHYFEEPYSQYLNLVRAWITR